MEYVLDYYTAMYYHQINQKSQNAKFEYKLPKVKTENEEENSNYKSPKSKLSFGMDSILAPRDNKENIQQKLRQEIIQKQRNNISNSISTFPRHPWNCPMPIAPIAGKYITIHYISSF